VRRRRLSSDDRPVRRTEQRSRLAAGHRHRRRVAALTAARTARSYQSDILACMETAWCDVLDWVVMSLCGEHRINLYPVGRGGPDPDLSFTGEGTAQNRRDPSTKAESEDPSPGSVTRPSWFTPAVIGARRCSEAWTHHGAGWHQAGFQIAPQRNHQLARQCHDGDLANAPFEVANALAEPAAQLAAGLMSHP
jgi:hypothetical protein